MNEPTNKSDGLVDSHIQMPKLLLKRFAAQKRHNWGCVICPQRDELDRLKAAETG